MLILSYRPAVGGCEYKRPNDPGNLQLDWLEVQLGLFRDKGIKVSAVHPLPKSSPPAPDQTKPPEVRVWGTDLRLSFLRYG